MRYIGAEPICGIGLMRLQKSSAFQSEIHNHCILLLLPAPAANTASHGFFVQQLVQNS